MNRYLALVDHLARRIADGDPPPGASLPSVRVTARTHRTSSATVTRAMAELTRAGVIETRPRAASRVAPGGRAAARRLIEGTASLRLAGSDDPGLELLLSGAATAVHMDPARGSTAGLEALWRSTADAAAIHLWHTDGSYNDPYARHLLRGRQPVIVRLWEREQGIVLPAGNPTPSAASRISSAPPSRTGRRDPGPGRWSAGGSATTASRGRRRRARGAEPPGRGGGRGVRHSNGGRVGARGAATLGLDFLPLAWEPFEIALPEDDLGPLEPFLAALAERGTRARIEALGGTTWRRAAPFVASSDGARPSLPLSRWARRPLASPRRASASGRARRARPGRPAGAPCRSGQEPPRIREQRPSAVADGVRPDLLEERADVVPRGHGSPVPRSSRVPSRPCRSARHRFSSMRTESCVGSVPSRSRRCRQHRGQRVDDRHHGSGVPDTCRLVRHPHLDRPVGRVRPHLPPEATFVRDGTGRPPQRSSAAYPAGVDSTGGTPWRGNSSASFGRTDQKPVSAPPRHGALPASAASVGR
jgi:hypothetical protein